MARRKPVSRASWFRFPAPKPIEEEPKRRTRRIRNPTPETHAKCANCGVWLHRAPRPDGNPSWCQEKACVYKRRTWERNRDAEARRKNQEWYWRKLGRERPKPTDLPRCSHCGKRVQHVQPGAVYHYCTRPTCVKAKKRAEYRRTKQDTNVTAT